MQIGCRMLLFSSLSRKRNYHKNAAKLYVVLTFQKPDQFC
ncbi:hypothetical protein NMS_2540 [Nonlabens marinus S1-08]|uniref:Uncharacterized protein n=1 Tax=Nonlabens marinus S1-08 TaxID=1454201 RepID=W8VRY3_9FLAO|nr:hypothetical protein NMS_2540 [Nonlabens marinus S1-08]